MSDTKLKLEVIMAAVDRITRPLKAVMDGSRQTSGEVKALRDKLKDLNTQAGQIESFRRLQSQTAVVGNNMAAAQDKVRQLAQQLQATEAPTKALTRAFEAAKSEANKLTTQHTEMTQRVQRQRDALNEAGLATTALAGHKRRLKAEVQSTTSALEAEQKKLEAINQRAQKLRAAQAEMTKTKATAEKLGQAGTTALAGGVAVGVAASVPVKAFADAEEAATNLKVAMMGVGGEVPVTYKKVSDLATQLGNKLPGTTADFMNMMTMLQRQGLSAEKVLGGVGVATAYMAVQLKKTPAAAAEFAAKMQDATRTVDNEMLALMDTIQRAYYLGVDDNNMLHAFTKLSPALSILRKEGAAAAKELAPLLVMADQAGMAGEQAGNAYRKIFQLAMGTKKIEKANAALVGTGVRLNFTDGKGEFGGIDQLFQQLGQLKAVNTQQRLAALKEAFGDDAETLQALTLIIEKGKAGYDDVARRMQAQADIQTRVNAQLGTLKNLWDAATGTFTNAMAAFGEAIAPQVKAATVWLGSLSERMQMWATQNPAMATALMNTIKWVGLLLLGFGALAIVVAALLGPFAMAKFALVSLGLTGSVLAPVLTAVTAALKFMGAALLFVGKLMLANPIGLAVAALATSALLIYTYWEPIKAFFSGIWTGLRTGTTEAWAWVTNHIASMAKTFSTLGGQLIDGLIQGLTNKLAQLKATVVGVATSVADWFKERLGIKSPSRVFMEFGGHTVAGLQNGIEANATGPIQAMQALATKMAAAGAGMAIGMGGAMAAPFKIDTRPPLTASAGAPALGAGTSVVNHITITASPGMDVAALARMVADEIENATRRSQVTNRSRLTDGD